MELWRLYWNGLVKKPHQPNGFQCWWNPVELVKFLASKELVELDFSRKTPPNHWVFCLTSKMAWTFTHVAQLLGPFFFVGWPGSLEPGGGVFVAQNSSFDVFFGGDQFSTRPPKLHAILRTWGGSVDGDLGDVFLVKNTPSVAGNMFGLSSGYKFLGRSQSFSIISWFQWTGGETNWKHDPWNGKAWNPTIHPNITIQASTCFFITKIVAVVFFGECNLYYICICVYSFDASLFFWEQHGDLKTTPRPPLPQGRAAPYRHWQLAWSSTTADGKLAIAAQGWQLAFRSQVILHAERQSYWEKFCREDGWMTRIWSKWYWRVSAEFAKFRM